MQRFLDVTDHSRLIMLSDQFHWSLLVKMDEEMLCFFDSNGRTTMPRKAFSLRTGVQPAASCFQTPFTSLNGSSDMTMFTQRETRILDQARDIISRYYQRGGSTLFPDDVRRCVMVELAPLEHEEFGIILDNHNQLLHREILFRVR